MKKLTRILAILIIVGLTMSVVAFFMGMDTNNLKAFFSDENSYSEKLTHQTDKTFSKLILDVDVRDVTFFESTDHTFSMTYYVHETKDVWTFDDSVEGTYKISQKENFRFSTIFNMKITPQYLRKVEIFLPSDWMMDIDIKTATGSVRMQYEDLVMFNDIKFVSNTGSIYLARIDSELMSLETDTGSIMLEDVIIDSDIDFQTNTGYITLLNVATHNLNLVSDTGRINLTRVFGKKLVAKVDTGRITIVNSEFLHSLSAESSTGDVIISLTDAASYTIKSSTGDVRVTLSDLSFLQYDLKTSVGKIYIDGDNQGNRHSTTTGTLLIKITVNTGNIHIED